MARETRKEQRSSTRKCCYCCMLGSHIKETDGMINLIAHFQLQPNCYQIYHTAIVVIIIIIVVVIVIIIIIVIVIIIIVFQSPAGKKGAKSPKDKKGEAPPAATPSKGI